MSFIYIIMGVSGVGKTTIGQQLSQHLNLPFADADDYHPSANVDKMSSGQALNDEDRQPWLERLAKVLAAAEQTTGLILACSALKATYRHTLTQGLTSAPIWVYLYAPAELIAQRMQERSGHFMPAALLQSQIATLEPPQDAIAIEVSGSPAETFTHLLNHL